MKVPKSLNIFTPKLFGVKKIKDKYLLTININNIKRGGKITFNILDHELVPKHEVLSEEEKKRVLEKFKITEEKLPKILESDPVVKKINAKVGDVIKITRKSPVKKESVYYRIVVKK